MKKLIAIILVAAAFASCTENSRARHWGGTETVTLEKGKRLVNITWKTEDKTSTSLWMLTKVDTTKPSTYEFSEKSSFGILEGKVIIVEQ